MKKNSKKIKIKKTEKPAVEKSEPVVKNTKEPRPKAKKGTFILAIIVSAIVVLGICVGIGCLIFASNLLEGKPEFAAENLKAENSSIIYDAEGNELVELGLYLRENIPYEEMPTCLVDAFLAIEDSRYFSHFGFDIPRFLKAAIANVRSGDFSQGGSTITMQLIKNTYFQVDAGSDSTIADRDGMSGVKRKMQEIVLAMEANHSVSKEEIFADFLNKINFGNNIRGIEKASQYYFGKSARELNISESAFLAGIINAPNNFNPYNELYKNDESYIYLNSNIEYLENAQIRRNEVLDLMVSHGYISQEEADLNKTIRIEDLLSGVANKFSSFSEHFQSYIDAVIDEAIEKTGLNPYDTAMKIYTNMDPYMQELVYNIQNENTSLKYTRENEQSAIVVLNNQNGALVALGGGRDQNEARQFNRATSAYIQPGSSIKPILEYALAFDRLGWSTSHTICDRPIYLYGSDILIVNAGNQGYTGDMYITEAIARSLNTPAIQTLEAVIDEIGEEEVIKYLNSIGIRATSDTFDLQYAIGGNKCLVTPVQLAGAHGMLINKGMYVEPHTIEHIEFSDGSKYVADTVGTRVLSEGGAYLTAYCEAYNVTGPFYNYMQILKSKYPVYAKTGTTDWGSAGKSYGIPVGAAKDSWLVCQTNNYTVTVWLGFDSMAKGSYFRSSDDKANLKGKIGRLILDELEEHFDYGPKAIEQPEEIVSIRHVRGAYPYCSPSGGHATVEGLVKKEFSELHSLSEIKKETIVGSLAGMGGKVNEDGTLTVYWYGFGGASAEGGMMDISATSLSGKTTHAVGRCYFPRYSYVNPAEFYATVTCNGYSMGISSAYPSAIVWADTSGSISVCGWTSSNPTQSCAVIK